MLVLVYLAASWLLGIYVADQLAVPLWMWLVACSSLIVLAMGWRHVARVRLAALCGLFLCLGAARYVLALPHFDEQSVSTYNDRGQVTLTGVVGAEPDVRDTYTNLRVRVETLQLDEEDPLDVRGSVLVRVPRYPEFEYGDLIQVRGSLETPPVFERFAYRDYLARKGIYSLVRWARVTVLDRGQGQPLLALLFRVKNHVQGVIARILPEPCAALLTGILLGNESGLPATLSTDFSITGTSHIIAISGFNMAIVSSLVAGVSIRLVGRRHAAWFSTVAIICYTILVGASAAVVRAAVMGCIAVWGEHFGRHNSSMNALMATALLMTAWNPYTLWDLGFLLSFAATMGLITLAEPLQQAFCRFLGRFLPGRWVDPVSDFLSEPIVFTSCAQMTTLPILLHSFGKLSLVALLANLLILPVQPQVMIFGAAAVGGGLIWLPLGQLMGWVAWLFLAYTIGMVEWMTHVPLASIDVGLDSPVLLWIWYASLGVLSWWMSLTKEKKQAFVERVLCALKRHTRIKATVGILALVALLVWLAVSAMPDGKLHITFLDVGQGNAALIETPSGHQVVVDGGPSATTMSAHLGRRMPFWDRTLDLVILSDVRDEVVAGVVPLVERYEVGHLWLPMSGQSTSATYQELQAMVKEQEIDVQTPLIGTVADMGDGVVLTAVHCDQDGGGPIVLRVDYGATCFLLAGSAGRDVEQAMMARGERVRCEVLQVGRHGTDAASSVHFVETVCPSLAVISVGEENRTDAPDDVVLSRLLEHGATVARTDELGSIEAISDGQEYVVRVRK